MIKICRWLSLSLMGCSLTGQAFADTVYVSLEKDNAVIAVDGISGTLGKTVPVGHRPRGIEAGRDGERLFVAASDDDAIDVLDSAGLRVSQRLVVDEAPKTFALSPDQSRLYASNDRDNQLTVLDLASRKVIKRIPVGREPEGISVSPDGRWVISTSEADSVAVWIDTRSLEVAERTPVAARPRYSRFTDDGKQLWVSSHDGACVTVIDTASRRPLKTVRFEVPGVPQGNLGPVGIRIDKAGRFAYIALGRANHVAVVDGQKLEAVAYIPVGKRVWNLEFSPDQSRLYAANGLSDDLHIIRLSDRSVIKTVPVGKGPWGIAVRP